jgi:excisionase family DNA binding protein
MRRTAILAAEWRDRARLLTTDDVAKELQISRRSVRRVAHRGELPFEPTRSGQLIFLKDDVERCRKQRRAVRLMTRAERLRAVRVGMAKAGLEPRQLSLWGERARPDRDTKGSAASRKTA